MENESKGKVGENISAETLEENETTARNKNEKTFSRPPTRHGREKETEIEDQTKNCQYEDIVKKVERWNLEENEERKSQFNNRSTILKVYSVKSQNCERNSQVSKSKVGKDKGDTYESDGTMTGTREERKEINKLMKDKSKCDREVTSDSQFQSKTSSSTNSQLSTFSNSASTKSNSNSVKIGKQKLNNKALSDSVKVHSECYQKWIVKKNDKRNKVEKENKREVKKKKEAEAQHKIMSEKCFEQWKKIKLGELKATRKLQKKHENKMMQINEEKKLRKQEDAKKVFEVWKEKYVNATKILQKTGLELKCKKNETKKINKEKQKDDTDKCFRAWKEAKNIVNKKTIKKEQRVQKKLNKMIEEKKVRDRAAEVAYKIWLNKKVVVITKDQGFNKILRKMKGLKESTMASK